MALLIHFDINGTITCHDSTEPGTPIQNANLLIAKNIFGSVTDQGWVLNDNYFERINAVSYYDYLKQSDKNCKSTAYKITDDYPELSYLVVKITTTPFLFPSFTKTLETYPDAKIVFRTFGNDADTLIEYLQRQWPERFKIVNKGQIVYQGDSPSLKVNGSTFDNMNKFFEYCDPIIIKEDYGYWNTHGRDARHGKCIEGTQRFRQIFFDDNECVNVIDTTNAKFVRVNTLQALIDEDYFNRFI